MTLEADSLSELVLRRAPLVRLLQRELERITTDIAESLIARAEAWYSEALVASKENPPFTFSNATKPTLAMAFYLKSKTTPEKSVYVQVDVSDGKEEGLEYVVTTLVAATNRPPGTSWGAVHERLRQVEGFTPPGTRSPSGPSNQRLWNSRMPFVRQSDSVALGETFSEHLASLPTALEVWLRYSDELERAKT